MREQEVLVDSHCHLNYKDFEADLPDVIARAQTAGVGTLLTINTRLSEAPALHHLADTYPFIYCSVGVHPHDAAEYVYEGVMADLQTLAAHPKVVGLGETGLDYYYNNSPAEAQQQSFRNHIQLSGALDLPLIIHTRDADTDTIALLDEQKSSAVRGVFHCFSGSEALAREALERGFYLSFSGIITFKKADLLRDVVRFVPLDRILVETDAPFLAPVPHRGGRNEPAYTRVVAEHLAQIKGMSFEEVAAVTTRNFFTLFNKATLVESL